MEVKLTNKAYWENNFKDIRPFKFPNTIPQDKYISKFLSYDTAKTCIEIGAFPGNHLGYFVIKYGYKPTALDFLDDMQFLKDNMEFNGINNCKVINEDFVKWQPQEKYDIVMSFGFLEHFLNYDDLIRKHVDLLKENGILIITMPNFNYFQYWIRKLLFTKTHFNVILESHNRKIMNLKLLESLLLKSDRMVILFSKYIRNMELWFTSDQDIIRGGRVKIFKFIGLAVKIVKKLNVSNKYISPEILLICQKK
jgi:cyclopropane fatty-acyl-phospholipid synthase-like methyltransferase